MITTRQFGHLNEELKGETCLLENSFMQVEEQLLQQTAVPTTFIFFSQYREKLKTFVSRNHTYGTDEIRWKK